MTGDKYVNGLTRRAFMEKAAVVTVATAAGSVYVPAVCRAAADGRYDTVIKDGRVFDGTGAPPVVADVGIKKDRIVAIGKIEAAGSHTINASGKIVTPGFIDIHTHCDLTFKRTGFKRFAAYFMPSWKGNYNYVTQGVTTVVTGNCGLGYTDTDRWLSMVATLGFGTNVGHLAPHGAIRESLFGNTQPGKPSAAQLDALRGRVSEEMAKGALGLSTGLEYAPGFLAETDELVALAQVVREHGGLYTTHMRDESGKRLPAGEIALLKSIEEAVTVAERAALPVEISHLKIAAPCQTVHTDRVIELISAARARGLAVTADQYPYAAGSTFLTYLLPHEFKAGDGVKDTYKTDTGRKTIARVATKIFAALPPDRILITMYAGQEEFEGKTIAQIAATQNRPAKEIFTELTCADNAPIAVFFSQDENVVKNLMVPAWIITASDGWTVPKGMSHPHPRVYGTFPRKLKKYVLDEKHIELARAVRSMTSLPARKFGIQQRGILKKGNFADIAVMDLAKLADHATYLDPHHYATGIEHVFVNGVATITDSLPTGDRGGRPLLNGKV